MTGSAGAPDAAAPGPAEVVAGIVIEGGAVLLARRAEGQLFAGKWEFPGGKVEPGETFEAALDREFTEELGVGAQAFREYHRIRYRNTLGREVRVRFYLARRGPGIPRPLEVAEVVWVAGPDLPGYEFIPANRPVMERLTADLREGRL